MLRLRTFGALALEGEGQPIEGAPTQHRRLALLAFLAVARGQGVSRDKILAYLWPESATDRARHCLAELLYITRRDFHCTNCLSGTMNLRINPAVMTTDIGDFQGALEAGDIRGAVSLYRGPFLDGFHLAHAKEFEYWAENQRAKLAAAYTETLEELATTATRRGDHRVAVSYWRRLVSTDALNDHFAHGLMIALIAEGDWSGALRFGQLHEQAVKDELGVGSAPAVKAMMELIKMPGAEGGGHA